MHEGRMPWPDLVLFADTRGEHPETYEYLDIIQNWLARVNGPQITVVKWESKTYASLEEQCNTTGMLPSPAYGGRSCSIRWKHDPMDKFVRKWKPAIETWGRGEKVRRLIGYHADEKKRRGATITEDDRFTYAFPLIEWKLGQGHCVEAIERNNLPVPIKSSCFFCPAKKKKEVFWLYNNHPDLFERAVAMEENAEARQDLEGRTDGAKGLGRRWSWKELIHGKPGQLKFLFEDPPQLPCMCWDGESND